jgi:hypothetical protein
VVEVRLEDEVDVLGGGLVCGLGEGGTELRSGGIVECFWYWCGRERGALQELERNAQLYSRQRSNWLPKDRKWRSQPS